MAEPFTPIPLQSSSPLQSPKSPWTHGMELPESPLRPRPHRDSTRTLVPLDFAVGSGRRKSDYHLQYLAQDAKRCVRTQGGSYQYPERRRSEK